MQCPKHPDIETHVRCGKCDRPICYRCSISGPAGMRCRECASLRSSPLYKVDPKFGIAAAVAAAAISCGGGYLVGSVNGSLFIQMWIAIIGGSLAGEAGRRIMGRKYGATAERIGTVAVGVGAALGISLQSLFRQPHAVDIAFVGVGPEWPRLLAAVAIMSGMAFSRMRYQ